MTKDKGQTKRIKMQASIIGETEMKATKGKMNQLWTDRISENSNVVKCQLRKNCLRSQE